jgi:hypothetical protein
VLALGGHLLRVLCTNLKKNSSRTRQALSFVRSLAFEEDGKHIHTWGGWSPDRHRHLSKLQKSQVKNTRILSQTKKKTPFFQLQSKTKQWQIRTTVDNSQYRKKNSLRWNDEVTAAEQMQMVVTWAHWFL